MLNSRLQTQQSTHIPGFDKRIEGNEDLPAEPILILGADGQLGSSFARRLDAQAISWTRGELDLARFDLLADALQRGLDALPAAPAAVINCAAYTKVDLAEKEPELCRAINTDAVQVLARVCNARGLRFGHRSEDDTALSVVLDDADAIPILTATGVVYTDGGG